MIFARLVAVMDGPARMVMRNEGLMRRMGEVLLLVVFRSLPVMSRSVLVMLRGEPVMFCAGAVLAHDSSDVASAG
jgi:hypothetical protein